MYLQPLSSIVSMMPLWLLASFVVEFLLLSLNVSVALFVAVQMLKRVPTFSTAFFVIYVLDSVVGSTHYLVVSASMGARFAQTETVPCSAPYRPPCTALRTVPFSSRTDES